MNAFTSFLKGEIAKQKEVSTGHVLLDRAFKIPLGSNLLIRSEPYAGATAIALELATTLTNSDKTVIYCDVLNSLFPHRLRGCNLNNLYIFRPHTLMAEEFLEILHSLNLTDPVIILDNLKFIESDWKNWDLVDVINRLRKICPKATIIGVQRKGSTNSIWSEVVDIKHEKNIYSDSDGTSCWMGHVVSLRGPHGLSKAYIEYVTGRVSKAFEHASLEIENGKARTSVFKLDSVECQGVWQFIHEHNRRLRDEI